MATVSVCMIVKDEEAVIKRCLSCVHAFADEIIVADTGSRDQTVSICEEMGAKVFSFPWQDDFAAARNFAFSKASCDYQFWLDADDVISEEDQEKLKQLKDTMDESVSVVMMRYEMQHEEHEAPVVFERERLLRRKDHFLWKGRVHESIEPSGKIMHSDIVIRHRKLQVNDPQRNLRIFRKMKAEGERFSPRDRFYYARELYQHAQYAEAAAEYEAFLQGHGWVEDQIQACLDLGGCLLQMNRREEAFSAYAMRSGSGSCTTAGMKRRNTGSGSPCTARGAVVLNKRMITVSFPAWSWRSSIITGTSVLWPKPGLHRLGISTRIIP